MKMLEKHGSRFDLEREIARANEAYFAARGIAIPTSLRKDTERDEGPPDEDTSDWPDDHKLDSPTHTPYNNLRHRR